MKGHYSREQLQFRHMPASSEQGTVIYKIVLYTFGELPIIAYREKIRLNISVLEKPNGNENLNAVTQSPSKLYLLLLLSHFSCVRLCATP